MRASIWDYLKTWKWKFAYCIGVVGVCVFYTAASSVNQTTATVQAIRMDGIITGGAIPYSDPVFTNMVSAIEAGNYVQAATDAVNSTYFPYYLPRRMAKEMMNNQMSEAGIIENDGEAFIVANWLGLAGTQPSIGAVWSQNATYCADVSKPGVGVGASQSENEGACVASGKNLVHITYAGDPLSWDWTNLLYKVNEQQANGFDPLNGETGKNVTILPRDVGGYMTLVDDEQGEANTNFASFAFVAGTNLRAIEYLYEIAFGVTLASMENTAGVTADMTPKFIPSDNPNFMNGNNQAACVACHAGGASSRLHGYAAFADLWDYDPGQTRAFYNGNPNYVINPNTAYQTGALGKSFGSNNDQGIRAGVGQCVDQTDYVCNPSSPGISAQGWDLSYWQTAGVLSRWGWNGAISGNGLQALGAAVGQATGVYTNMVQRVINEICPLGSFSQTQIDNMGSAAMSQESAAQSSSTHVSTDQGAYGYIVVHVASDPSCI
jgi:hypothetical protein